MSVNVNEVIRKLSPAEREKVEDRAAEISMIVSTGFWHFLLQTRRVHASRRATIGSIFVARLAGR
jgi:hypothetical protein